MARPKVGDTRANEGAAELEPSEGVEPERVLPTFAEVYEKLAEPFEKTYTRQIPGGASLTYITGEQAISRLTEVMGPHWDWTVTKQEIQGGPEKGYHAVVSGILSLTFITSDLKAEWGTVVTREGIGGSAVKMKRDGTFLDIGNDFKAAETGALKRAAAKFGVGLYLYEKGEGGESELPSAGGGQAYGQQGSYTPAENRQPVQFARNAAPMTGNSLTGTITRKSENGIVLDNNGTWLNTSKFADPPINLAGFQIGQTVHVEHSGERNGRYYIDRIQPVAVGAGSVAEEVDAF